MTDYKDTLNLPKTEFPMKANLAVRELSILDYWKKINIYEEIRNFSAGKKKFILHDGPPYANGSIHLGHAVNKVLKDAIVKVKTMSGYDSPYIPGWDCHGLPIEIKVEQKVGRAGQKISVADFRNKCRDFANKQIEAQKKDFIRLGVIGNWQDAYLTKDYKYEADELRFLAKVIAKNHLYRGRRPVYWSVGARSALAEAEIEYQNKQSKAVDVSFEFVDTEQVLKLFIKSDSKLKLLEKDKINAVIWTTTPWTLPGNEAIAVGKNIDYVLVKTENSCLVLAKNLFEKCLNRYGIENYEVFQTTQGKNLEGLLVNHPFYKKKVPICLGEHVEDEEGTGLVHTAPSHGVEDFDMANKYGLSTLCPVNDFGNYIQDVEFFAGENVLKADDKIIAKLTETKSLLSCEKYYHSYPHCWRTKTPLIYRTTNQWFISMEKQKLRQTALDSIKKVNWVPDWGQQRIEAMIANRPDWCISRQRYWGVPIAVFIHKKTAELHPDTINILEKVAKGVEEHSVDYWYNLDPKDLIGADSENYEKVNDILDVWFDSGASHYCVFKKRENAQLPVQMYLEGSDQHRGWFHSSLLLSSAVYGEAPYESVLTHGFTVDGEGKKMSKSEGNVVLPQQIIAQNGADIVRLLTGLADYRYEINISSEILKRTIDAYRRFRNTIRYLLSNLSDFDPEKNMVKMVDMLSLDKWILSCTKIMQDKVVAHYNNYEFHSALQNILVFCTNNLGSLYLDVIKDRQYTCQVNSLARRSAQSAIYHISESLIRLLAPILSYTTEEAWQYLPGNRKKSVHVNQWYEGLLEIEGTPNYRQDFWQNILAIRQSVYKKIESLRAKSEVTSSLTAIVEIYCNEQLHSQFADVENELKFFMITSEVQVNKINDQAISLYEKNELYEAVPDLDECYIKVSQTNKPKCERCWHHSELSKDHTHKNICNRCLDNVLGKGEQRFFA